MELDVLDFPTPADALAAARDGDVVYFCGSIGEHQAPSGGFRITKSIELCGDGPGNPGTTCCSTPARSPRWTAATSTAST